MGLLVQVANEKWRKNRIEEDEIDLSNPQNTVRGRTHKLECHPGVNFHSLNTGVRERGSDFFILCFDGTPKVMPYSVPMNATGGTRPFQCQVCFEELSAADTVTLEACSHACCRKCLRQHVTGKISCGQLSPGCFYPISHTGGRPQLCPGVVSEAEIERLVDPKTLIMYRRFQFNAQHPVLGRQCPHCDHCQVFPHGKQQADCTCEACGTTFCFSHSLAHVDRTCGEYEDAIRQVEHVTITVIERTTKRCPECDLTIEKDGTSSLLQSVESPCSRSQTLCCSQAVAIT
jgi:hypothetical protein